MKPRRFLLAAILLASPLTQAAPYTLSTDGQEVTDQTTGLIWLRCTEGMVWNGTTCTGSPLHFTLENALIRAKDQATASSKAWRLPNVRELSSLVDRSRIHPSIDISAFPATPVALFLSASPYAGNFGFAWGVDFGWGGSNFVHVNGSDGTHGAIRLIRSSQ